MTSFSFWLSLQDFQISFTEDICTGVEHSMDCQRNYKLLIEVPLRIIFLLFCLIFHT